MKNYRVIIFDPASGGHIEHIGTFSGQNPEDVVSLYTALYKFPKGFALLVVEGDTIVGTYFDY